ncbi:MAG: hypothetical protein AB3N18_07420 [Allomuricauda sp.]
MRIQVVCLIYLMSLGINDLLGQIGASDKVDNLYQETEFVFMHHNTSLLFSGEYLYYSLHVLTSTTNMPSTFSKIGYVELIGEDGKVVFRHKIKLDNGMGQGEFFVPVTVPSGNYKLIGYTQWMRNFAISRIFQSDIGIINPFQNNQEAILAASNVSEECSLCDKRKAEREKISSDDKVFTLAVGKKVLKKRDQGNLIINALGNSEFRGNFSLSIRKIDSLAQFLAPTSIDYSKNYLKEKEVLENGDTEKYLPELRGELVSGKIIPKNPNFAPKEEVVAFSIPGKNFILKLARTNEMGEFYFSLNLDYSNENGFVQVLGEHKDEYEIQVKELPSVEHKNLNFNKFVVAPEMENLILKRSVYNQVENAFTEIKPDSIRHSQQTTPIYRSFPISYDLDDYTRFSTIRETAKEVLEHVWVSKNIEGEEVLEIRGKDGNAEIGFLPLVMLDGVLIQRHADIIDFDAKKIKRINISRDECVVNSIIYEGIIAMESIDGNSFQNIKKDYLNAFKLFTPLPRKKYFNQKYNNNNREFSRQVPDFRQQLLWIPQLVLEGNKREIDFYTSDVPGSYEISLEGYTSTGTPVSLKEVVEVE